MQVVLKMSWLNPLNDSLNKMKSILAEGIEVITEERHEEPEISKEEHENLQKILEVQNEEVCYDFVLRFTLSFFALCT